MQINIYQLSVSNKAVGGNVYVPLKHWMTLEKSKMAISNVEGQKCTIFGANGNPK